MTSKTTMPERYIWRPYGTTGTYTVRLAPAQYDWRPNGTIISRTVRMVPARYDWRPHGTTGAITVPLAPAQYDWRDSCSHTTIWRPWFMVALGQPRVGRQKLRKQPNTWRVLPSCGCWRVLACWGATVPSPVARPLTSNVKTLSCSQ